MTTQAERGDNNYIPRDLEDLWRHYIQGDGRGNSLTHTLIRKFVRHASNEEKEDLAQEVFLRIASSNMMERWDPAKCNFGGVIFFVTRSICVNYLSRKSRNPLGSLRAGSLVETDPDSETFEPGVYSLDKIFHIDAPDNDAAMDAAALVQMLRSATKALYDKPRHKRDESLYPLLGMLLEQKDPQDCGPALGVTPSTIHNWMGILRDMAKELMTTLEESVRPPKRRKPRRIVAQKEPVEFQGMPFVDV